MKNTDSFVHGYILATLYPIWNEARIIFDTFREDLNNILSTKTRTNPPRLLVNRGYITDESLRTEVDQLSEKYAEIQYGGRPLGIAENKSTGK